MQCWTVPKDNACARSARLHSWRHRIALSLTHIELFFALDGWSSDYDIGYSELPRRVRNFFPQLITVLSDIGITMAVWR
jgi:hypothetical protein